MRIRIKYWIVLSAASYLICLTPLIGQQKTIPILRNYSIEEGLSSRFIETVLEDSRGFLWFGHQDGIERFDGKEFKCFFFDPPLPKFDQFHRMVEGPKGLFWLMSGNNYSLLFDPVSEKFLTFQDAFKGECPFQGSEIEYLSLLVNGDVWIQLLDGRHYSFDGAFQLEYQEKRNENLLSVLKMPDGTFYKLDGKKVIHVDGSDSLLRVHQLPYRCVELIVDEKAIVWPVPIEYPPFDSVGYIKDDKQYFLRFENPEWQMNSRNSLDKLRIHHDRRGIVVVQLYGLLQSYSFPEFKPIANLSKTLESIGGTRYYLHTELDRQGDIWCATHKGVYFLAIKFNPFETILSGKQSREISVRNLTEGFDGKMYINTYEGMWNYDLKNEVIEEYHSEFTSNGVGLYVTKDNDIWRGQHIAIIQKIDVANDTVYEYRLEGKKLKVESRFFIDDELSNNFYVGLSDGLGLVKIDSGIVTRTLSKSLNGLSLRCFLKDGKNLWIGTDSGLYLIDETRESAKQLEAFSNYKILHLYIDDEGIFWIATDGSGLLRWDRKKDEIEIINKSNGLSNNTIYAIYEDEKKSLWLPSNYGLMRYFKENHRVDNYLEGDGIAHNEFNYLAHHQASDGRLFLGGLNGVTIFDPKEIGKSDLLHPPIYITSIRTIKNRKWTSLPTNSSRIVLSPESSSLRIKLTMLEYMDPEDIRYAYKIEGVNEDWIFIEDDFLNFAGLPYGNFLLRIKGQGAGGGWSENELALPLEVRRPFYRSIWFYLIFLSILTSIIVYFHYQWLKILKARKESLEIEVNRRSLEIIQKNEELLKANLFKDRLFAIIAHDMRNAFLTFRGISKKITYLLVNDQPERVIKMGKDIDAASTHIELLMDNFLNWAIGQQNMIPIHPININLYSEVENTFLVSNRIAESKGVKLINKVNPDAELFADSNALGIILRNLISNAIKFSNKGGTVEFKSIDESDTHHTFAIIDNGVGISDGALKNIFLLEANESTRGTRGEKGSGIGLPMTNVLVQQNNGKIEVRSKVGVGTKIFISLPKKKVGSNKKAPNEIGANNVGFQMIPDLKDASE